MNSANSSPYPTTASELVQRFASSSARVTILDGLLRYRSALRGLGFVNGFQWLDGSFVEDVEAREQRDPRDIDLVTFAHAPAGMSKDDVRRLLPQRPELFDIDRCKAEFHCDPKLVSLGAAPEWLVMQTRYWYGLFSHRRGDMLWKGMLEVPLDSDDAQARTLLDPLMPQGGSDAGTT